MRSSLLGFCSTQDLFSLLFVFFSFNFNFASFLTYYSSILRCSVYSFCFGAKRPFAARRIIHQFSLGRSQFAACALRLPLHPLLPPPLGNPFCVVQSAWPSVTCNSRPAAGIFQRLPPRPPAHIQNTAPVRALHCLLCVDWLFSNSQTQSRLCRQTPRRPGCCCL
ncbi:hypothetical protein GGI43DRAFT_148495 [Trichoderma evansii]